MTQRESEKLFDKAVGHKQAVRDLELEAAASGRRLTEEDKAYLTELEEEGSQIIGTADRASQQEKSGRLGKVITSDVHGNLLNDREVKEVQLNGPETKAGTGGRTTD